MESHSVRRRILGFASHILLIAIIFILPEFVMTVAMPHRHEQGIYTGMYLRTAIYLAAFYINYFLIIDRTLAKNISGRNLLRFVLWNLLVISAVLFVCYLMSRYNYQRKHQMPPADLHSTLRIFSFLVRDLVMVILIIGLAVAMRLSTKWQDMQRQKQELRAAQRDSELAGLKSQLNPHFLFNTLNTIYALIEIDGSKAQKAVHQLSTLLRYMLYDDSQSVELSKECKFVENYVELMRMRVANHPIDVKIDMGKHADTLIPSLLFIPLVENAVKYGITAPDNNPIEIRIEATDNQLVCCTRNSFVQAAEAGGKEKKSGIGLANLRRRIALIYGSRASLTTGINNNIFSSRLTVPL